MFSWKIPLPTYRSLWISLIHNQVFKTPSTDRYFLLQIFLISSSYNLFTFRLLVHTANRTSPVPQAFTTRGPVLSPLSLLNFTCEPSQ